MKERALNPRSGMFCPSSFSIEVNAGPLRESAQTERIDRRKELMALLKDAKAGLFDDVVVHTTDRWARNIGAQSQALQRLAEAGVGFASVNEDIDFTSPEGRLLLIMLGATGGIVYFLVQDGPFDVPALRLNPRYLLHTIRSPAPRMVFFGYLGHMWELYAMWAAIPIFMGVVLGTKSLVGDFLDLASFITFLIFVAGAVACVAAGYFAERFGRTLATSLAMIISGGSALFIGFLPLNWPVVIVGVALIWGASVIADSGQFSTALTELTEEAYRGTALAFQTGLGFLVTIIPIKLLPVLVDSVGWGLAFAMLAIGPALGTIAMLKLRAMPEASGMALGRR